MTKLGSPLGHRKGAIFSSCPWNIRFDLLPKNESEGFTGPDRTLPRASGHHAEWIEACKGRGRTFSSNPLRQRNSGALQLGTVGSAWEFRIGELDVPGAPWSHHSGPLPEGTVRCLAPGHYWPSQRRYCSLYLIKLTRSLGTIPYSGVP
jgi:hypothetical protein